MNKKRISDWPRQRGARKQIIELLQEGWSAEDVAAEIGCSVDYIRQIVKKEREKKQLAMRD